ncbi:alternate-type signal peptide domain-containing protein [Arthrobacter koreensis]|uniref:alternate-type signal peptide domain-containing protein n=1 Tax=Arthrobacter TaxID=1663 RepID=UPI000ABF6CCF|nr:alternate-type signal peptide domain-containing protein [Arthrobacter koreensis]MEB7448932.1 alternate-type signal peptide domain-containing protein [Arthrobacter koreensis]
MNKMAKGALATGVGVALLLGGGGTLAIWNDTANATTGSIVAGNLDLESGAAVWKKSDGTVIPNISNYKVVPGEVLKFEQPLTIELSGDQLKATLAPDFGATSNGFSSQLSYDYKITQAGTELKGRDLTSANSGAALVTATVTFNKAAGNDTRKATQDLSKITYKLDQVIR